MSSQRSSECMVHALFKAFVLCIGGSDEDKIWCCLWCVLGDSKASTAMALELPVAMSY